MGICNGFQVLTECGLLPGALMRNEHLRFSCKYVRLRVETNSSTFTRACVRGEILKIPIAHGEGNYYHFDDDVKRLEDNGQVIFRYVDTAGEASREANPNGSLNNIAGITNEQGNILGMMPHPERSVEPALGSADGLRVFESVRASFSSTVTAERT